MQVTFDSAADLAAALHRAAAAHGPHEEQIGPATRTGRTGTRRTWWMSRPGAPARPARERAHE
jgi:hypothetical protein